MILEPADVDLKWAAAEANFREIPAMAEAEWKAAGVVMPDDAAEGLMLDLMDKFLAATASALGMPLQDVFPARHRITWFTFTDTPGPFHTFAKLDDEPPCMIVDLPCSASSPIPWSKSEQA